MEENQEKKEPTTSDEDVEGHGWNERPVGDSAEAASESPDVEGHALSERPVGD